MGQPVIAIMDSTRALQETIQDGLAGAGYHAVGWPSGERAGEWLVREPPALVIVNLRVGPIDPDLAVLQLLRRDPATWAIPVIVCSADADYLRQHAARLRGKGCSVLHKPFARRELLALVAAAIGPGQPG